MATTKPKVLVTGASGLIGGLVLRDLGDKYEFSAVNRSKVEGVPCLQADIADLDTILPAFEGMDMVLHLSAYTDDIHEWDGTLSVNIVGTYNVYEAARQHGIKRIVFGSTGSTMCGYEHDSPYGDLAAGEYDKVTPPWTMIDHLWPVRPDSIYGVSKVFCEALGRYYCDYYGISVLNIRLGAVLDTDRPKLRRHFPGYLSQSDCVQMIDKCLSAPDDLRFDIFDAISENKWRWRETAHAKEVLGWEPTGSSDIFDL